MRKLAIERVDNGYVVTVHDEGVSELKRRYEKPKLVFPSTSELVSWLERELGREEPIDA